MEWQMSGGENEGNKSKMQGQLTEREEIEHLLRDGEGEVEAEGETEEGIEGSKVQETVTAAVDERKK